MKEELAMGEGKSVPGQGRLRSRTKPGTLSWGQEARMASPEIGKNNCYLMQKTKGRSSEAVRPKSGIITIFKDYTRY